jgi:photosystem II stability/assembly factor-like uncharacterized protein
MAYGQQVTFTALPNGVNASNGNLKVSVHVAPRLEGGGNGTALSNWADWLDWPSVKPKFSVILNGDSANPVAATIVSATPRSDLWKGLFNASTPVNPFPLPDLTNRFILTSPALHLRNFIRDQYVGMFGTSLPDASAIQNSLGDCLTGLIASNPPDTGTSDGPPAIAASSRQDPAYQGTRYPQAPITHNTYDDTGLYGDPNANPPTQGALKQYETEVRRTRATKPPADTPSAYVQHLRFHQSFLTNGYRDSSGKPRAKQVAPTIDFHQMLATANEHPTLLRLLGLVFDLEFALPSNVSSLTTVQISPQVTYQFGGSTMTVRPITHCTYGQNAAYNRLQFTAAPRDASVQVDGAIPLDDTTQYDVVEIDHDAAALKTFDFAKHVLVQSSVTNTPSTPDIHFPPALRSPGLKVCHHSRAEQVLSQLQSQNDVNGGGTAPEIYAEDIARGYVVHVYDSLTKNWHSLTKRTGEYDFPAIGKSVAVADEAALSVSTTSDPTQPDGTGDEHRVSPNLFHWTGWSLAAQHPGNQLDKHGQSVQITNAPLQGGFQFAAKFQATPGSLPRLRYGQTYSFRARPVDLAGNSLPFDAAATDKHATAPVAYTRFEPVNQPVLLMRLPRTEGESLERMVIRSNYNTASTADDERHVAPPKTPELMAEFHGMFDTATNLDPNSYGLIKSLVDGNWATSGHGTPDPSDPSSAYQPQSFYFDSNQLTLPYLPDVLSRGAAFANLPGSGDIVKVPFVPISGKSWPYLMPFRLALTEGSTASYSLPSSSNNVLTVAIPKAVVTDVQLSSYVDEADLPLLGQFVWSQGSDPTNYNNYLRSNAVAGQLWAITPYRTLTLVHAVRQPLQTPEFSQNFLANKSQIGQTYALLNDLMSFDRPSTSKVHIHASWNEAIDRGPGTAAPALVPAGQVALDVALWKPQPPGQVPDAFPPDGLIVLNQRHEFGDPKFRKITYQAEATTAFAEYFFQTLDVALSSSPVTIDANGFVPNTVSVKSLQGSVVQPQDLNGVSFADAANGWAVGKGGTLIATTNGGESWHLLAAPAGQDLYGVSFLDTSKGWIVGNNKTLLKTVNGGASWSALTFPAGAPTLNDVAFVNTTPGPTGYAVGSGGTILKSLDGGNSWGAQLTGTTKNLLAVSFPDASHGWAVGQSGTILTTSNGGSSWTALASPTTNDLTGVSFVPSGGSFKGVVVGKSGTIFSTADGGATWLALNSPTTQNLLGVALVDAGAAWLVGQGGAIFESLTSGAKWTPVQSTYVAGVPTDKLAPPTLNSLTTSNGGGTFPSVGPFFYVITALSADGESLPSVEQKVTLSSTSNNVVLTWLAQPGATGGFKIYRGSASGRESALIHTLAAGSTTFTDTGLAGTLAFPPDYAENQTLGTITRGAASAIPLGGTVAVRYLANPISRTGVAREMKVLNSKRPSAPQVAYVLPTFSWQRSNDASGIHSTRKGGTVRVYVERPWWSSGEGELLGVVTWHGPTGNTSQDANIDKQTGVPTLLEKYITRIGNDPVHASPATVFTTEVDDFPLAVASRQKTSLVELPGDPNNGSGARYDAINAVDVAGHKVAYDPQTDMWFADIQVDVGDVYWPYVRLALARWQPDSLIRGTEYPVDQTWTGNQPGPAVIHDDTDLSPVVLADFIQLAPDRALTVTHGAGPNANQLKIALVGRSYDAVDSGTTPSGQNGVPGQTSPVGAVPMSGPSQVYVTLEQQDPTIGSDLGWKTVVGTKMDASAPFTGTNGAGSNTYGPTTWQTSLDLPTTGGTFRLVIEEFESYPPATGSFDSDGNPNFSQRLVHTDIVNLSPTGSSGGSGGGGTTPPPPPTIDIVGQKGAIATSTNIGMSWQALSSGVTSDLNDVAVAGTAFAAAVGQGGVVLTSTNGGKNWTKQPSGTTKNLRGVSFVDSSHGWAVGQGGTILVTSNGGGTWSAQKSPKANDLNGISFFDLQHGWAVGQGGIVLATTDGGATWVAQTVPTTKNLLDVVFIDALRGWIVGQGGTILMTGNGGGTWNAQKAPLTQDLSGVSFSDANNGWAVGANGTILNTGNGGSTWGTQTSGTKNALNGVMFIDATHGVVVGASQTILETTNGFSWSAVTSPAAVSWTEVN